MSWACYLLTVVIAVNIAVATSGPSPWHTQSMILVVESAVEQVACWQQLALGLRVPFRQAIPNSEMTARARLQCAGLVRTVEDTLRFSWHPKALSWNRRASLHTDPVGTLDRQDANTATGPIVNRAG